VELEKITDFIWEIKKSENMNVPARVFADEQLLKKMQQDKTLEQCKNVASLPGIYKYSIVLPDGHQGYGFPIGGVAALDFENGAISPGGVGYDINCLLPGTKIITSLGYWRPIEAFESAVTDYEIISNYKVSFKIWQKLMCVHNKKLSEEPIIAFMKKKADNRILCIETKTGLKIKCSEDHPIFNGKEFKRAGELNENDKISVVYFEGCEYEPVPNAENVEEKIGLLAKIFGYLLGDGSLTLSNGKYRVCAYGKKTDLENIKKDIEKLGYHSKIIQRVRYATIKTQYGEKRFKSSTAELHIYSQEFCKLMIKLGMPVGKKTNTEFLIPKWIMNAPKWIKRLFLAGFFGAELTTPKTHSKTGFYAPIISQNKNENFKQNGRKFLIQLIKLLEEFDIKVTKISERKEFRNKEGNVVRLRLEISANEDNLLKLWRRIGYEYNEERSLVAEIAVQYILLKKKLTNKRRCINKKVKELKKVGMKLREIQEMLCDKDVNKRFIERCFYENSEQRITLDFPSFEKFKKEKLREISEYGTLLDEIEKISVIEYNGFVYDFTVSNAHNFIANGIVVSNCGVRLVRTNLGINDVKGRMKQLLEVIFKNVPSGVGVGARVKLTRNQLIEVLQNGAKWAVDNGYGYEKDLEVLEENGCMPADISAVTEKAMKRGMPQLGCLGAGNHFLEIQVVDKIFNKEIAEKFGIENEGQVMVMIHTGSRGFGHQICTDFLREMEEKYRDLVAKLPDRELVYAPADSELAEKYYKAMCAAANFAWCNRQMIVHWVRESFEDVLGMKSEEIGLDIVYDVAHNIAKIEEHKINGEVKKCYVHRKGATRAFPKGHRDVPEKYRDVGQPVIIPGSMGTASYVLVGNPEAMDLSFGSTAHGAGRELSRTAAIKRFWGKTVAKELENQKGILVRAASWKVVAEEAPQAYKDIDRVAEVTEKAGISNRVVRLVPLGVVKG